ncbi:MAG: hypothetical protein Tsb005_04610 [Gammaproteobacteria bacterium]
MNTLILAAGSADYQNIAQGLTGSKLLTTINGRPIIAWVIRNALQYTQDRITLVVNQQDAEMIEFYNRRYALNDRVHLCVIERSISIPHSLSAGLDSLPTSELNQPVRVNFGDTLLNGEYWDHLDCIYVSNFSYSSTAWCVLTMDQAGDIQQYYNKKPGLRSPQYKALVGRSIFSEGKLLKQAVTASIKNAELEFSNILQHYAELKPLRTYEIAEQAWIDFGHLEGFAKARMQLIESRSFNHLSLHPILPEITKQSSAEKKLAQEVFWYQNLPVALQSITPRILAHDNQRVRLEYYGYGTLAEKFLYFDLSDNFWEDVLSKLFKIVNLFKQYQPENSSSVFCAKSIYLDKTLSRLAQLPEQNSIWQLLLTVPTITINEISYDGLPTLLKFVEQNCLRLTQSVTPSIIHGDMCFNNILYDVASGVIKLIDPRGEFGAGVQTIYGDPRYDIAKIRHSFCGNYDQIIEGDFYLAINFETNFSFKIFSQRQHERDNLFDYVCNVFGYNSEDIRFIEALLFLSMIPLHQESLHKQLAFFINGIQKLNYCYQTWQYKQQHSLEVEA